ncbi:MAG: alpha/beta hydrolase [Eubacterium sp.]|nr:alpha/beta hydrolase [Eubacterium sp.]
MEKTYEQVQKEVYKAGEVTSSISDKVKAQGDRYLVPLDDRQVEIVCYRAMSEAARNPVIFGMHGGGFVVGGCAFDDGLWDALRRRTGCTVISIGYRKAPNHPFPAAIHDVYDAMSYCIEEKLRFPFDRGRINLFGSSAGATLAASVTLLSQRLGLPTIDKLLLNYPYLDLATDLEEKGAQGNDALTSRVFRDSYVKDYNAKEPFISPIYTESSELADFPDTYISVCENDTLRAEGEEFARKLKAAGVYVETTMAEGMPHAYFEHNFGKAMPGEKDEIASIRADGSMAARSDETLEFFARAVTD